MNVRRQILGAAALALFASAVLPKLTLTVKCRASSSGVPVVPPTW
jgi:hypothetical protein